MENEEGLFDEFVEDTPIEDTVEAEPTETETVETETAPVPTEPFLKIKYDKEEIGLSQDEARELAQKGKNYDRLFDRYNSLNEPIEKLARMYDMDVPSFIKSLNDTQMKFEVNNELQTLKEMYPTAGDDVLQELASRRVEERLGAREKEAEVTKQKEVDAQEREVKRQLDLFRSEYPNLEPDKLDPKVYEYVRNGYTLLEAFNKWMRSEEAKNKPVEDSKAKARQMNEENKSKSLGSTQNVGAVESDDFMSGFLSI